MKKQVINVILSAIIFSASPLFAMDEEGKEKETPLVKPSMRVLSKEEIISSLKKTNFKNIPFEVLVIVFRNLSIQDVGRTSLTSRAFWSLGKGADIWGPYCPINTLNPKKWVIDYCKEQHDWPLNFINYYNNLSFNFDALKKFDEDSYNSFPRNNIKAIVHWKTFKHFLANPEHDSDDDHFDDDHSDDVVFNFCIKNKKYCTETSDTNNDNWLEFFSDTDRKLLLSPLNSPNMKLLDDNDKITFYGFPDVGGMNNESSACAQFKAEFFIVTNGIYAHVIDRSILNESVTPRLLLRQKDECIRIFEEKIKSKPQVIQNPIQVFSGKFYIIGD